MQFSTALGFRFCDFLDALQSPVDGRGDGLSLKQLSLAWRVPESSLRGWRDKPASPDFDRLCEFFLCMSSSQQDLLLAGLTHACPEIVLSRQPVVRAHERQLMTIALEVTRSDQQLLMLANDSRLTPREKLQQIQELNQLRRRLGEEMIASLQWQIAHQAIPMRAG